MGIVKLDTCGSAFFIYLWDLISLTWLYKLDLEQCATQQCYVVDWLIDQSIKIDGSRKREREKKKEIEREDI